MPPSRRPSLSWLRRLRIAGLRRPGTGLNRMRIPIALAAVAVVMGGLAVWFGLEAHDLHSGSAARNTALTDSATTSEVNGQITSAVNTIFSYDYTNAAEHRQAARKLLTGKAVEQYDDLIEQVRQQAQKQKLAITTTVTKTGVSTLHGDRAHLLIFADQQVTRSDDNRTSYAGAMLAVDAVRRDGTWRISNIRTFSGGS